MKESRMRVVNDTTPLNGSSIDVGARIAWTMRMARLTAARDDVRLRTIADEIGTSAARLSRIETGQLRDGSVTDAYEVALGLVPRSLRAPIDITCRTFPGQAPPDANPGTLLDTVGELSQISELILENEIVSGAQWLAWARTLARDGNTAMPERLARQAISRLSDGLGRSVSHAYATRYEALAQLRCSAYGHLVVAVAREKAALPHSHGLADLFSAVGEYKSADAVAWCLELLSDPDEHLATCGALALENVGEISGDGFWEEIADDVLHAFDHAPPGSRQEEWIAHLIRLVPPEVWRRRGLSPARPLPAAPRLPDPDDGETHRIWQVCVASAQAIGASVGVGDQPMLARLLFDISYGHWESRAVTGYMLLSGIPALTAVASEHLARLAEDADDPMLRSRAARRLYGALHGHDLAAVPRWLVSGNRDQEVAALRIAGGAGRIIAHDTLSGFLHRDDTATAAIEAAGMSQHPDLQTFAEDPTLSRDVRAGLRWWLEHGGRLSD